MRIRRKGRRRRPIALPTMFTVGTLFCGYFTLVQTVRAVALPAHRLAEAAVLLDHAAIAIGIAMLTDGLDGRIARMTKATSKFGGELDSLADCITFGAGPAVLAYAWGMRAPVPDGYPGLASALLPTLGYFCTFLYLTGGAARLARFNVQANPRPRNPGPKHRSYFVGMPIPPSAGLLGAFVHFHQGRPLESWWPGGLLWCGLLASLALLMISGWRYRSFKEINFLGRPLSVLFCATLIFLVWNFSRPVLLTMALTFASSGVLARLGGLFRRRGPESGDSPGEQPDDDRGRG